MTTSGTSDAFLNNGDIILEAFDRCEVRPADLTREQLFSARRSLNLELSTWSNESLNLWKVELLQITLEQGVFEYTLPANVISVLDTFVRTYQLDNVLTGGTPSFSTVSGQETVTINFPNHGLTSGQYLNIQTPVAISNLLLQDFFSVINVIDLNNYQITAPVAASATVTNGGVLPIFTTSAGSDLITVNLPNHNLQPGLTFDAEIPTVVGGLTIDGAYVVQSVSTTSVFTISASMEAATDDTETMNYGNFQFQSQSPNAQPTDIILTPLGRSEYASQPNKFTQAKPTSYWFNRQSPQPQIILWQVPNANGPYQLNMYVMYQIQDAYAVNGQTADIPYRFQEALAANMAKRFALKFKPSKFALLKEEAKEAWDAASLEDREKVDIHVVPDTSSYYRS